MSTERRSENALAKGQASNQFFILPLMQISSDFRLAMNIQRFHEQSVCK